jgi:hypothetical protein
MVWSYAFHMDQGFIVMRSINTIGARLSVSQKPQMQSFFRQRPLDIVKVEMARIGFVKAQEFRSVKQLFCYGVKDNIGQIHELAKNALGFGNVAFNNLGFKMEHPDPEKKR